MSYITFLAVEISAQGLGFQSLITEPEEMFDVSKSGRKSKSVKEMNRGCKQRLLKKSRCLVAKDAFIHRSRGNGNMIFVRTDHLFFSRHRYGLAAHEGGGCFARLGCGKWLLHRCSLRGRGSLGGIDSGCVLDGRGRSLLGCLWDVGHVEKRGIRYYPRSMIEKELVGGKQKDAGEAG